MLFEQTIRITVLIFLFAHKYHITFHLAQKWLSIAFTLYYLNFSLNLRFLVVLRCHHNTNSRCVHCSALEPYDEGYLKEQNVKHLSFHSYLRKMTSGADRGKFLALEDISCRIKSGCKDHPPWPKGICSKCQPNAITLNRQVGVEK